MPRAGRISSSAGFGSLALAAYRNIELIHVGNVRTGFRALDVAKLRKIDQKLRHPSYKGLRERQDNADVFQLD